VISSVGAQTPISAFGIEPEARVEHGRATREERGMASRTQADLPTRVASVAATFGRRWLDPDHEGATIHDVGSRVY
jgi:hypothetical protein